MNNMIQSPFRRRVVLNYRRLRAFLNPLCHLAAVRHQPADDEMGDSTERKKRHSGYDDVTLSAVAITNLISSVATISCLPLESSFGLSSFHSREE